MSSRIQSPSYPSTPLEKAIDLVRKFHSAERTNVVDREVAAKAMGFSGISGHSAKVLSNLIQYGLIEKAGKNEVRVTGRAVELLHPESTQSRNDALVEAAFSPALFQKIGERFPDGQPSDNALRSYLVRENFTDAAIPSALRAYRETYQYLERLHAADSYEINDEKDDEQPSIQRDNSDDMERSRDLPVSSSERSSIRKPVSAIEKPEFRWSDGKIWLDGGVITNQDEADAVIAFINAVKPMLNSEAKVDVPAPVDAGAENGETDNASDTGTAGSP